MSNDLCYLDYAAAAPMDKKVLDAMLPYFSDNFYNPSSPYAPAVRVKRDYSDAKHRIAVCIGAKPDELIMTAGATESINLALSNASGHIVTSAIEHPAVLEIAKQQDYSLVKPNEKGLISPDAVGKSIRSDTTRVSIALANNELGTIQPIKEIAAIVEQERIRRAESGATTPIYFHIDASQGVGQLDVHVARLGVDMMTINSAKIYGPKQVGCLWAASHVRLTPTIFGGGQERGLRSGTENVAGVIGFARAIELSMKHQKSETKRLKELRDYLQKNLEKAIPEMVVSNHAKRSLVGHLHVSFPGIDAERLVFGLENVGVLVATGSACAANKATRSHVLEAINMPEDLADGSLRITLGRFTTKQQIEYASLKITEVVQAEMKRISK